MPVFAELIQDPSDQDRKDLELTYGEIPATPEGTLLVGARFNGRLLGCLLLENKGDHHQLRELNIREFTRRRGVARQLLMKLLRQPPEGVSAIRADLSQHPELQGFFSEMGFAQQGELWHWQ